MNVSVVIPIHNGEKWIDDCFEAIKNQTALNKISFEVCVCNDASIDKTSSKLQEWENIMKSCNISLKVFNNSSCKGVGYAKNRCVDISTGDYLCFQDVDDVMLPDRILKQYGIAEILPKSTLIGARFKREPENSTKRFTNWANNLNEEQLNVQIYTSHGPTVIMPTWFCHKAVYHKVGGFSEEGTGTPEDLIFFYKHIDLQGNVHRLNHELLVYRYHEGATTFSIDENTIWKIRLEHLEANVLSKWDKFTIWNAGKQGRKFYNSLKPENRSKVIALCDVDAKKIGKRYEPYDQKLRKAGNALNIVHWKVARPPFVICMKLDLTGGVFEKNLSSLNLKESCDYIIFS